MRNFKVDLDVERGDLQGKEEKKKWNGKSVGIGEIAYRKIDRNLDVGRPVSEQVGKRGI